jgi:hypothetical protein
MREVTSHKVNGLNDGLRVVTEDEIGDGGAHHKYGVHWNNHGYEGSNGIKFQKGPIAENGFNGVSNESLIAIVLDRLECFQAGGYACRENALAITKLQEAMHWLHHRTRERIARGVEGTSQK